jgi:hypothetical protein
MSEHQFFDKKKKANQRKVIVSSPVGLQGKAPTKDKRIKLKVQMPLSGQKMVGMPEWMINAYDFVSNNHDTVTPELQFRGFDLEFSSQNLFGANAIKAPKAQMKSFEITEAGDSENPEIVLNFLVYAPFSTKLWEWLGQMYGDDIWCKFVQSVEEKSDDLELTAEEPEEADAEGE